MQPSGRTLTLLKSCGGSTTCQACASNPQVMLLRYTKYLDHSQLQNMQHLSSAVSHGNKSYYTNSSSTSLVTTVRNYVCMCAADTSHSYYSRVVFISLGLLIVQLLFESGIYWKIYVVFHLTLLSLQTN